MTRQDIIAALWHGRLQTTYRDDFITGDKLITQRREVLSAIRSLAQRGDGALQVSARHLS